MSSFYFYDLETSGINPRSSRIMQFAGQRTDMSLKPIAEPDNIIIKLSDEVLPEPEAIMVTGITPQSTQVEGMTEYEFLKYFHAEIATPDTIFVGFNNVRFDDEFIRFTNYRNFYDAYEWSWRDNRSRWDLLDVIRLTRALRPDGIQWPFASDGKPTNRLELITELNGLDHANAHDALSDVNATIAVARLIRNKQPKLFEYLLELRNKNKIKELVASNQKFIYCSGKYPSAYEKVTVVASLGDNPNKQGIFVYDLRRDPEDIAHLSPAELAVAWRERVEDETMRFPIKTLQFNKCPAVAPLTVLESDPKSQEKIKIDLEQIEKNYQKLIKYPDINNKLVDAMKILDKQNQASFLPDTLNVDAQLYDGFFDDADRTGMSVVRAADSDEIASLDIEFHDQRLNGLLPLYKARNFKQALDSDQMAEWEKYRHNFLLSGGESSRAAKYFEKLSVLMSQYASDAQKQYLLQELQLYGESIIPEQD